jgi:hypothetical protein
LQKDLTVTANVTGSGTSHADLHNDRTPICTTLPVQQRHATNYSMHASDCTPILSVSAASADELHGDSDSQAAVITKEIGRFGHISS